MQFRLLILISLISLISITGLYAYAVTLDVTPIAQVNDDSDTLLKGAMDIAIATIDDSTYAVVSSNVEHGIQIIDISDPSNPTAVSSLGDDGGNTLLRKSNGNEIYTIGGSTYLVVASNKDHGIQIIDISDPTNPTAVGKLGGGVTSGKLSLIHI